jgi:hypothetical protein
MKSFELNVALILQYSNTYIYHIILSQYVSHVVHTIIDIYIENTCDLNIYIYSINASSLYRPIKRCMQSFIQNMTHIRQ